MESARKVNRPDCVNASNPFHRCAAYCSSSHRLLPASKQEIKAVKNSATAVQNGHKSNGDAGSLRTERNVDPLRNNVSNHKSNGDAGSSRCERKVDPLCINASNPFHHCAEYCVRRSPDGRKRSDGSKSVEGVVTTSENRKVNPSCVNASNPFHECAEYCAERSPGQPEGGKSVLFANGSNTNGSSGHSMVVTEKRSVHPQCVNASNPFHICAEYCMQRIHEAT